MRSQPKTPYFIALGQRPFGFVLDSSLCVCAHSLPRKCPLHPVFHGPLPTLKAGPPLSRVLAHIHAHTHACTCTRGLPGPEQASSASHDAAGQDPGARSRRMSASQGAALGLPPPAFPPPEARGQGCPDKGASSCPRGCATSATNSRPQLSSP